MGGLRRQKQDAIIVDPATRGKLALVQAANSRLSLVVILMTTGPFTCCDYLTHNVLDTGNGTI